MSVMMGSSENPKRQANNFLVAVIASSGKPDAIRNNEQYLGCHSEVIRQTTIEWFHGNRDRYNGRAKRRRTADMAPLDCSATSRDCTSKKVTR
nr:unnamed protein product [Spirometra erinaceieuropaei]